MSDIVSINQIKAQNFISERSFNLTLSLSAHNIISSKKDKGSRKEMTMVSKKVIFHLWNVYVYKTDEMCRVVDATIAILKFKNCAPTFVGWSAFLL